MIVFFQKKTTKLETKKTNEEAIVKKINEHAIDTFEFSSCKSDFRRFFFFLYGTREKSEKHECRIKMNRFGNIILCTHIRSSPRHNLHLINHL